MATLDDKVKIFKALAEPNRLRILKMLQARRLCVCELTEILGLATSTVSSHLAMLTEAGFIIEEKDGKWVNYEIQPHPDDPAAAALGSILHAILNDVEEIKADRRAVAIVDRLVICK